MPGTGWATKKKILHDKRSPFLRQSLSGVTTLLYRLLDDLVERFSDDRFIKYLRILTIT